MVVAAALGAVVASTVVAPALARVVGAALAVGVAETEPGVAALSRPLALQADSNSATVSEKDTAPRFLFCTPIPKDHAPTLVVPPSTESIGSLPPISS